MVLFKNFKANLTLAGDLDTTKNDVALKGAADLGPTDGFPVARRRQGRV